MEAKYSSEISDCSKRIEEVTFKETEDFDVL
jgi:hypothetical protein